MLTINIIADNQYLDLFPDTSLSIELTNPLFAERGSSSLPIDLPASPHNMKLLDFPGSMVAAKTWTSAFQVLVTTDIFQWFATLQVISISETTISVSILFAETAFYNAIADQMLPDIFTQVRTFPCENRDIYSYLALLAHGYLTDDDITVFPVDTDRLPLNAFKLGTNNISHDATLNVDYYPFIAAVPRQVVIDETTYNAPAGFGISPFLYLKSILQHIFSHYGYSMLDTDIFNDVVVPTPTADAILDGKIVYSRLLPTVSISDFLFAVRAQFGADFFVLPDATVKWVSLAEIFTATPSVDLTNYLSATPSITLSNPQAVELIPSLTKDDMTIPVSSYDALKKREGFVDNTTIDTEYRDCRDFNMGDSIHRNYIRRIFDGVWVANKLSAPYVQNAIPILAPDQFTPVTPEGEYLLPVAVPRGHGTKYYSIPYIGDFRHIISVISITEDDETKILETDAEVPVMFLFASHGIIDSILDEQLELPYNSGTTFIVDNINAMYDDIPIIAVSNARSLAPGGPYGTYDRIYREYDEALKNSWHTISASLLLSPATLLQFSFDAPVILQAQPLMPIMLRLTITPNGISTVDAEFRTIKPYTKPLILKPLIFQS